MKTLLLLAGSGQLALAVGTLWIPRILGWREETRRLEPLTRSVFWTYAGYIWTAHVCFALVSILLPEELMSGTLLARSVAGFISAWWSVRLILQWWFRKLGPQGPIYLAGELALTLVFLACSVFYGMIAVGFEL